MALWPPVLVLQTVSVSSQRQRPVPTVAAKYRCPLVAANRAFMEHSIEHPIEHSIPPPQAKPPWNLAEPKPSPMASIPPALGEGCTFATSLLGMRRPATLAEAAGADGRHFLDPEWLIDTYSQTANGRCQSMPPVPATSPW